MEQRRPQLPDPSTPRSWRVIAQELSSEVDSERLTELSAELTRALDKQELTERLNGHSDHPFAAKSFRCGEYEEIVDRAVALMRSDYASVQMLFPERGSGGELLLLSFRGFNPEAATFWEWVRADSKSTCGIALRDRKRVVAPDIASCEFMAGSEDQEIYLQTGIGACQTTPLIGSAGNVVGMISTHWQRPHQPSNDDLHLFDRLAREAAEVIEIRKREQS
jgi:GAF domain-containing protein